MTITQKGRRLKGKRGEREVAALWREYGWPKAVPTPGSGGLRPHGAGDLSPWPGDIHGIAPWLCEVKYDEKVRDPSRGWQGEAFIRATLKDLQKLSDRHAGIVGAEDPLPVLFARGSFEWWRVFVPASHFIETYGRPQTVAWTPEEWAEVGTDEFFEHFATPPPS